MKFYLFTLYILIAVIGSTCKIVDSDEKWNSWKFTYKKQYDSLVEETNRKSTWLANLRRIKAHNLEYKKRRVSFKMGINQFGDLSLKEFQKIYQNRSFKHRSSKYLSSFYTTKQQTFNTSYDEQNVDWRKKGYVTPVQFQSNCSSCYSFTATGALEALHVKKYGKLIKLSEQNIVDCSSTYGNNGCDRGSIILAFKFIIENGIQAAESYPYTAKEGKCLHNKTLVVATMKNYIRIRNSNEELLAQTLSTVGPTAANVHSKTPSWQFYQSGIFYDPQCKNYIFDHAVLVVGYGSKNNKHYWIVKNSWGASWGMKGYMLLERNRNNHCGIAKYVAYPE